jgi:hypothetical protein
MYVFGTLVRSTCCRTTPKARAQRSPTYPRLHPAEPRLACDEPGALGDLNRLAAGRTEVDPTLLPLLHEARDLAARSWRPVSPAIGRLDRLWDSTTTRCQSAPPPHRAAVAGLVAARPAWTNDVRRPPRRQPQPHVQIDLGGRQGGAERALDQLSPRSAAATLVNSAATSRCPAPQRPPLADGVRHPPGALRRDRHRSKSAAAWRW